MIKVLNSKLLITLAMLISIVCVGISATVGSAEENEPRAAAQTVQFTVKHNIRDIDADSYTAISSDKKEARAEDADSIKISDIVSDRWTSEGFVFEENRSTITFGEATAAITSGSVNVSPHGDDHAVIELYYDRPEYPYVISYVLDNGSGNATEIKRSLPDNPYQPMGKTVSATAPDVLSEDTDDETEIIYERTDSASKTVNVAPESDYIGDNGAIDPYKVKNNVITFCYAIKDTANPEDDSEAEESETATGELIIAQSGGRDNESFLYRITSDEGTALTVSVKGGGSATIVIPLGRFTIEEISDWSWRYGTKSASQEITIDDPSNNKTVTFSNEPNDKLWQGGEGSNSGHF